MSSAYAGFFIDCCQISFLILSELRWINYITPETIKKPMVTN